MFHTTQPSRTPARTSALVLLAIVSLIVSLFAMAAPLAATHQPNHGTENLAQHCPDKDNANKVEADSNGDGTTTINGVTITSDGNTLTFTNTNGGSTALITWCAKGGRQFSGTGDTDANYHTGVQSQSLTQAGTAGATATVTFNVGKNVSYFIPYTVTLTALGTITVVKDTVPDAAQDFAFTTTGTGLSSFSLDDDADATLSNTKTFTGLAAGTYSVTEGADAGYTLSNLTCTTGGVGSPATRTATITLVAGQTVTCTFQNTVVPPAPGTITIVKDTVPNAAQDFAFTTTGTGLSGFSLDDDTDATLSNTKTFSGLAAGSYSVTESVDAGYSLSDLDCTAGGVGNTTTRTATITLTAGQTVTCTFENTVNVPRDTTGEIAIFKTLCDSIGDQNTCNGRDTSLSGFMVDFRIYAGDDNVGDFQTATVTLSENAEGEGNVGAGSQGRIVTEGLTPGTYTVCEIPVAYQLDAGVRINETDLDATPRPEAGNGGSTGGGQTVLAGTDCIVVQVTSGRAEVKFLDLVAEEQGPQLGSITIIKNTIGDDAQDFGFTTTGTGLSNFTLDDDADRTLSNQRTFTGLAAGSYTVAENTTTGWGLTSLTCSTGGAVDATNPRQANITLTAGANVTCTFVNSRQASGTLGNNPTPRPTPTQAPVRGGTLPSTGIPNTSTMPDAGIGLAGILGMLLLVGSGIGLTSSLGLGRRRR